MRFWPISCVRAKSWRAFVFLKAHNEKCKEGIRLADKSVLDCEHLAQRECMSKIINGVGDWCFGSLLGAKKVPVYVFV